ncbi:thymosin beta-4-like [Odocoileus virginianus]|uniref:Thymosin beta-4-like n=1 Tax=Odocoileus virginianus TaxID=9874 RepID=A0ABM4H9K4_ODOVR
MAAIADLTHSQLAQLRLQPCLTNPPDMAEIEKFCKKKKSRMQEKNPLPSKEMIEKEKQAGES